MKKTSNFVVFLSIGQ